MLKVEIFKQGTTVLLAATKLWLFYKKLPFSFLSPLSEQCHSNGCAPAWYLVFSWWIYSPWIAAVRGGRAALAPILLLPMSGAQHTLVLLSPPCTNLAAPLGVTLGSGGAWKA